MLPCNMLTRYGIATGDAGRVLALPEHFYIVQREKHETCLRRSRVGEGRHGVVRVEVRVSCLDG